MPTMKLFGSTMAFLRILRGISLEEIQREAETALTIGVIGFVPADCDLLSSLLTGFPRELASSSHTFTRLTWPLPTEESGVLNDVDLIIYVTGAGDAVPDHALEALRNRARGLTPLIVVRHGILPAAETNGEEKGPHGVFKKTVVVSHLNSGQVKEAVVPAIIGLLPDHAVALGRRFAPFREASAAKVIRDTSMANAQFAALSNLPALIPVVGNLIAATADFFILTQNQIVLLLKLAAIYGRDLSVARNIYLEILPVVGAGLVWRTVARELAVLLPGLLGAVPKVLIAFAGTYTVGQTAAYYYDHGRRPPAEIARSFNTRAAELGSSLLPGLRAKADLLRMRRPEA